MNHPTPPTSPTPSTEPMPGKRIGLLEGLVGWASLFRLSNLPTIFTNALVGLALAHALDAVHSPPWNAWWIATLGLTCAYLGGMAMNDVVDAPRDRRTRADRPLARGQVRYTHALAATLVLLAAAAALLFAVGLRTGVLGLVLLACIAAYNTLHAERPWAVIFMGLCRGLCYLIPASAVIDATPLPSSVDSASIIALPFAAALLVGVYTIGITFIARVEASRPTDSRRWLGLIMPALAAPAWLLAQGDDPWLVAVATAMFVLWSAFAAVRAARHDVRAAVLAWLAGFCLLDAMLLALLERPALFGFAVIGFAVTRLAHRRISGT